MGSQSNAVETNISFYTRVRITVHYDCEKSLVKTSTNGTVIASVAREALYHWVCQLQTEGKVCLHFRATGNTAGCHCVVFGLLNCTT